MPEINEQYDWPTGRHPDLGDPDTNHILNYEVTRLQEKNERAAEVTKGVQDVPPPLVSGKVPTLEEMDLLRYTVLVERAQKLQLMLEKQAIEFKLLQEQQRVNGSELGALLDRLGVKYSVDFHDNRIEPSGRITPYAQR